MDIGNRFLKLLNDNVKQNEDTFSICPKVFYQGLTEEEIRSMQQLYSIAYEKARAKIQNKYDGFYDGGGI